MDVFAISMLLKEEGAAIVKAAMDKLKQSMDSTTTSGKKLDKTTSELTGKFKQLAASMATVYGVGQLGQMADSYTNLNARLGLVTKSSEELISVQKQLFAIAQASRTPFEEIVGLYLRTANSAQALGLSQADVIRLTEQTAKAVALSGSSAAEAAAAIQQLGQAFGNGAVQAQEWNSLAEQTPRLAKAIAESFNMTTAEFRKAVLEQRVTSAALAQAILQNQKLAAEFAKLPTTIGGAFTQLRNQIALMVGEINKGTGASEAIVKLLGWIRENIPTIAGVIAAATTVWAGYRLALIGVAAAKMAVGAASAFMSANVAQMAGVAVGTATALTVFAEVYSRLNKLVSQPLGTTGGGAGATAGDPFKPLSLGLAKTDKEGKTVIEMLTELAAIAPITQAQSNQLAAAYDALTVRLKDGNLALEKRLKIEQQRAAIAKAQAEATVITPQSEIDAMERRMGQRIGQPIQAALGPKQITEVNPKIVAAVRQQSAQLFGELNSVYAQDLTNFATGLATAIRDTLVDAFAAGIETAIATGSMTQGFKELTKTLLSGLGSMLIQFGKSLIPIGALMAKVRAALVSLSPAGIVAAGIGMIAIGAAMRGAATAAFGGGAASGGAAVTSTAMNSAGTSNSLQLPGLYYGPTAAGSASTIQQIQPMQVTIIGPNDPSAQRQMQELMRNANRRGNV